MPRDIPAVPVRKRKGSLLHLYRREEVTFCAIKGWHLLRAAVTAMYLLSSVKDSRALGFTFSFNLRMAVLQGGEISLAYVFRAVRAQVGTPHLAKASDVIKALVAGTWVRAVSSVQKGS